MGYWGTGILENDGATGYLCSYFDLYDEGKEHLKIREELEAFFLEHGWTTYEDWLYLAYCQWKCGFFDGEVLKKVEEIIVSGIDRQSWMEGQASQKDIEIRKNKLNNFYKKLQIPNERPLKRGTWSARRL